MSRSQPNGHQLDKGRSGRARATIVTVAVAVLVSGVVGVATASATSCPSGTTASSTCGGQAQPQGVRWQ
jgi:hypothetical protein